MPVSDKDWWRGAAIYQIYPRSFADSNGDGIGDLAGITARLDYVAGLGVDAIWLSPFFKSPMKDFGYDVEDYCDVDPMFGTLADFDALIARAHGLGLKVMIDQVLSHAADTHPWFKESRSGKTNPKADWFVWADAKPDGTPPNNWLSIFGGSAWQWDTRRQQYYMHNFLVSQPDINFHNPEVRAALYATVKFWLDRGVDGFRHDTLNYYSHDRKLRNNPPSNTHGTTDVPAANPYGWQEHVYDKTRPENIQVLKDLRKLFDSYPNIAAVGEIGAGAEANRVIAEYTSGNDKFHMCYGFDLLAGKSCTAKAIVNAVSEFESASKDGWICWALSNHDVTRVVTRWGAEGDAQAFAPMANAMLLCLRGSQCLYQGEELGLPEADVPYELLQDPYGKTFWPEFKGRDGCRTPMPWTDAPGAGFTEGANPWLPIPDAHRALSVANQQHDAVSALVRTTTFLHWRKTHPALRLGSIKFCSAAEPVLAFEREHGGEKILCVFNLGTAPVQFDARAYVNLHPLDGHGFKSKLLQGLVALPPRSAFFGQL